MKRAGDAGLSQEIASQALPRRRRAVQPGTVGRSLVGFANLPSHPQLHLFLTLRRGRRLLRHVRGTRTTRDRSGRLYSRRGLFLDAALPSSTPHCLPRRLHALSLSAPVDATQYLLRLPSPPPLLTLSLPLSPPRPEDLPRPPPLFFPPLLTLHPSLRTLDISGNDSSTGIQRIFLSRQGLTIINRAPGEDPGSYKDGRGSSVAAIFDIAQTYRARETLQYAMRRVERIRATRDAVGALEMVRSLEGLKAAMLLDQD